MAQRQIEECEELSEPLKLEDCELRVFFSYCCGDCRLYAIMPGGSRLRSASWCCDYGHDTRAEMAFCARKKLASGVAVKL